MSVKSKESFPERTRVFTKRKGPGRVGDGFPLRNKDKETRKEGEERTTGSKRENRGDPSRANTRREARATLKGEKREREPDVEEANGRVLLRHDDNARDAGGSALWSQIPLLVHF